MASVSYIPVIALLRLHEDPTPSTNSIAAKLQRPGNATSKIPSLQMAEQDAKEEVGSENGRTSPTKSSEGRPPASGRKRTRTGCLNCRRKRRKCDETKPTCEGCQARREFCEWGVRLSFRPENAHHMDNEHPSMRKSSTVRPQSFQIVNVTSEVIRDYIEEAPEPMLEQTTSNQSVAPAPTPASAKRAMPEITTSSSNGTGEVLPSLVTPSTPSSVAKVLEANGLAFLSPQISDSAFEDGIFLPGSQYQELHAQLRSRIIDTARSTVPSRLGTPEYDIKSSEIPTDDTFDLGGDDEESRLLARLSPEQEYVLWQNYIDEVAGWLDKFDINRHFELVLPMLAKSHPHLKYAILALSARQMERKQKQLDYSCSLALYQRAIHLLSPSLHKRTTEVLATCIVLCVLEMLSCSPKAWRRHLDGCAALIQALNISGASGGLEQALFWTFARMDICGGLISAERTLIPMHKWMCGSDILLDIAMFGAQGTFDMYANHIVYLCGRVVDLLCSYGRWEQRNHRRSNLSDIVDYTTDWSQLFELVESWYYNRPEEMKPLLAIPSSGRDPSKPFPTLLYGNGPAVSGNQMYHTAALLMLKYKPAHYQFLKKPHSILWHARQICAISISNAHHGCWTNSTQPLWLAGQQMSHPSEHKAILDIYERIERETG